MNSEFLHRMSRGNCTTQAMFGLSQYRACPLTVVLQQLNLATNDACLLQNIYVCAHSLKKCWEKFEGLARQTRLLGMARQAWQGRYGKLYEPLSTAISTHMADTVQVHTVSTQWPELWAQTLYICCRQTCIIGRFSQYCQGMMYGTVKGQHSPCYNSDHISQILQAMDMRLAPLDTAKIEVLCGMVSHTTIILALLPIPTHPPDYTRIIKLCLYLMLEPCHTNLTFTLTFVPVWNSLPAHIVNSTSPSAFKS